MQGVVFLRRLKTVVHRQRHPAVSYTATGGASLSNELQRLLSLCNLEYIFQKHQKYDTGEAQYAGDETIDEIYCKAESEDCSEEIEDNE